MEKENLRGGTSLAETPSWAVATVVTVMVSFGFFLHGSLKRFGKWLDKTKRKSLLAALEKIKDELMLFGLLSLLMGHWIVFVAKICVKSSALSSRFYPCARGSVGLGTAEHVFVTSSKYLNDTVFRQLKSTSQHDYCPEGRESFASYESLEQLHHFIFVLGITHVSYSFIAAALAMIKIYSWRTWENQAKTMAIQSIQDSPQAASYTLKMRRLSTFAFYHVSHPWSQHRVLVWLLCFSRQFWCSINRADYMALRLGFITNHQLPLTYDFHNYMLRSMEEEFRDIVGISVPFWIYAILCIFLNFHGANIYFWLSFLPAILILLIGTKLHRVVVKLAVEIMDMCPTIGYHHFKLRDELFWFGRPKLLLWLIQLISFQNAFEMASFIWALWDFKDPSCFMENHSFIIVRLAFGVLSQCWCSFITFPLYVIIAQMGSRFQRSVVSEYVRESLSKWKRRARARQSSSVALLRATASTSSLDSMANDTNSSVGFALTDKEKNSPEEADASVLAGEASGQSPSSSNQKKLKVPLSFYLQQDSSRDDKNQGDHIDSYGTSDVVEDDTCLIPPP